MPLEPSQFAARLGLLPTAGRVFFGLVHLGAAGTPPLFSPPAVSIAIGLFLGGIALFLWAQETVKQTPPYLAFSGAVPVATFKPWLLASAVIMTMNYVAAAFEAEAAFAR